MRVYGAFPNGLSDRGKPVLSAGGSASDFDCHSQSGRSFEYCHAHFNAKSCGRPCVETRADGTARHSRLWESRIDWVSAMGVTWQSLKSQ